MEERKFVEFKKDEREMREFVKRNLGKGRISDVIVEYTPVGEKIVVSTNKPGIVIGRKGERIDELTRTLKKRFKLENPHIEIQEITKPNFDAQLVADDIAIGLERLGNLKFKVIAYKTLQKIMDSGAMGAEIVLAGRLPSERSRTWRFASGYLKKTGGQSDVVDRAEAKAVTQSGTVGIKVSILSPDTELQDRVEVNQEMIDKIKLNKTKIKEENKDKKKSNSKKKAKEDKK